MKVKITSIADLGVLEKERIVMKVLSSTDIGSYVIFEAIYREGNITTGVKNVFWFPDKEVSAGDFVVLYTKQGKQNEKILESGNKSHFFYWGSNDSKWKTNKMAPVLLAISDWQTFRS
jgi:hypothetical protein